MADIDKRPEFLIKDFRRFANSVHLNMKLLPGKNVFEYSSTRIVWEAWKERSRLIGNADLDAVWNAAMQHASEVIYSLGGTDAAKILQNLKNKRDDLR
jgi:hypothetical protein